MQAFYQGLFTRSSFYAMSADTLLTHRGWSASPGISALCRLDEMRDVYERQATGRMSFSDLATVTTCSPA